MLEQFREFANRKIVKWIFAIFLVIPFGLFGIDFYFRTPTGGDTIATVGRTRIGAADFDQALRRQADIYRQQFRGQFDQSIMDNPEIRGAVLDRLIDERLLSLGSERAGIRLSDRQLAERIVSDPTFQVDGKFSKERYEAIARANGLSAAGLDERLREQFREERFRNAIVDTAFVPTSTLDAFIRLSEQTRDVAVVNLTPDQYMAKVKVTPEQVKAYYAAHAPEFTTPEQAKVDYIELSLDTLAAQSQVTPEQVKQAYEQELQAGKWGRPEERRASHILISVKPDAKEPEKKAALARAQEIAAAVRKNPKSFAEVAKKDSQDPGSGAQGGDLGFFARGAMVKPFEDAVFGAKKGDILGPVQSDFGYHVILVTDIKPANVKSLAEATPELEAALKKQDASRRMAEAAETFSNVVYEKPDSLQGAADALKLPIRHSDWIQKGVPASPPYLSNAKMTAEIFSDNSIKAKRNTSAVEVAPNVLVAARVADHKPAELRPLETVQADIEKRLARDEALKLAAADGAAKLKDLQAGKDLGFKWPTPLAVNRQKSGGLMPNVIEAVFRADPKKLPAFVGVDTPMGYSLVQVSKVNEPVAIDDARRKALGDRLRDAAGQEEFDATLGSLREKIGVSVAKNALAKSTTATAADQ
jgi:peptidyl-prolyl cis-trans isomerase D